MAGRGFSSNSQMFFLQAQADLMKADHAMLLQLEQVAADRFASPVIFQDLQTIITPAVRMLYLAYEENAYNPRSPGGEHILRGLTHCLPDSKIVEDLHGVLRNNSKTGQNKRQTLHGLQELVTQSSVLESRGIGHKACVDREVFLEQFPRTKDKKRKRCGVIAKSHNGSEPALGF